MDISEIGVDLSKTIFVLHGINERGGKEYRIIYLITTTERRDSQPHLGRVWIA